MVRSATGPAAGAWGADQATDAPAVGGVTVLGELGRGAQSVVYRVRRGAADFAMKVLHSSLDGDPQAVAAFRREAALLALAGHSGLARVHEVGVADDRPYLIMDLVDGGELADVLRDGPLPEDRVLAIGLEVADVLAAVHRVGLVHRDIKPHNILLQPDGPARLIDLGLAAHSTTSMARPCPGAGTLMYSAPEQVGTLKRPVDGRSDLYSLGVVLFECAAGQPPFASADVGELLRMHATTPPPDLAALRPGLSPGLVSVIGKLLEKDPDDRYAGCAGLVADLRALAADRTAVPALAGGGGGGGGGGGTITVPLVGREAELAELTTLWSDVRAGGGALAVLRGGPGSGKSRLAAHFVAGLAKAGVPVLAAACVDGAAPLAPLAGAVERYVGEIDGRSAEAVNWVRTAAGLTAPYLRRLAPGLARLLGDAADVTDEAVHEGFVRAVAGFVTDLAGAAGGAVLLLDDVQWLDGASLRVLQHVVAEMRGGPLLVLAVAADRADGTDELPFAPFVAADLVLRLGQLESGDLVQIVTSLAGDLALDPDLLERVVARGGGSPLGVLEYLQAVLDAGLIVPCWGRWVLDLDGLDHVDLPTTVIGLVQHRIDGLGECSRTLLTAAAVVGMRFTTALPARVAGMDPDEAAELFDSAVARGLLDRHDGGYAFVHDRARRALLEGRSEAALKDLHQRTADLLAGDAARGDGRTDGRGDGPARAYALARHALSGHPERDRTRTFAACLAAGRHALDAHAAREAVEFLRAALTHADTATPATLSEVYEALGTAYHQAGHLADAHDALTAALAGALDPLARARLLEQIARILQATWRLEDTLDVVRRGLAECGRPLPANPVWRVVTALAMYLAGVFVERTRIGFGTGDPARHRLLVALHASGLHAAVRSLRPGLTVVLTLRCRYLAARLGPSLERVQAAGNAAAVFQFMTGRPNRRGFARAARMAERLGSPTGIVSVGFIHRLVDTQTGQPDTEAQMRWLKQHAALVEQSGHIDLPHALCNRALVRGRAVEALAAYEHGRTRVAAGDLTVHPYGQLGLAAAASVGRLTDARTNLLLLDQDVPAFRDRGGRINLIASCATLAIEQREFGAAFDRIAAEFAAVRVHPIRLLPTLRQIYACLAYGRLEQCRLATDADRPRALAAAAEAVKRLRRASFGNGPGPQLRAHHGVAGAHLRHLRGDPAGALDQLATVDRALRDQDVPLASYEAARVRARAMIALGRDDEAAAVAAGALALAERLGWPHRAEWIRGEFGAAAPGSAPSSDRTPRYGPTVASAGPLDTDRRRLAALEQLSVTASRILDPDELTRVALDETLRILAAERAYLFLTDGDDARLLPHLGRDAAGNDLDVLTDYGSTVVERVRQTHQPVIVTGTDEGAALGSRSVVTHGLRSIMAAPLQFDGRLLGVVYLDSRIAKGMFAAADIGILTAITNHIAAALETTRAAQLAVAVRAAEQERDVANKLCDAMVDFSGSLDPADVLRRLHRTLNRFLPSDTARLVRVRDGVMTAVRDIDQDARPEPVLAPYLLARILAGPVATGAGDAAPREPLVLGDPRPDSSWLAVPLRNHDRLVGAVVLTRAARDAYSPTEVQLAAALAGEAMVAYDNALLFAQVEAMATTDVLTGVSNRRHFFTVAERDVAEAGGRMMAIMLDIDHFKRINDEYGHQVGDQVIRTVADRLRGTARATDRLGRYGGEEFAILLPDTSPDTADLGERLRAAVADVPVETDVGGLPVTVSVGVRLFEPGVEDLAAALNGADAALYRAKQAGRNRVVTDAG
jgi:diguanylate cyclase (GGDEF)-like protein